MNWKVIDRMYELAERDERRKLVERELRRPGSNVVPFRRPPSLSQHRRY